MPRSRKGIAAIALVIVLTAGGVMAWVVRNGNNNADVEVSESQQTEHAQAVVTAHELATEAGFEILEAGGTAADAAVGVAAVMSVVEPWFSSALGGGTWALYYDAENDEVTSLDGVGPTGSNATLADYRQRAGESGAHQANVPGAWDGWMLWLDRYGNLDLPDVLAPAITIGREGFPAPPEMIEWLGRQSLSRQSTSRIYQPGGQALGEGDTVYQRDLADTFEALADAYADNLEEGRSEAVQSARDYYYRGPLARAIVGFSDNEGGYLTMDDFRNFEAEIVEPISIDYNDEVTVYQSPPNSQGITMLIALNILKGFDFSELDSEDADTLHRQVEALRLAFTDRYHHVGDPDRIDVPVERLLSDGHAAQQRERINMDSVHQWPIGDGLSQSVQFDPRETGTTTFHIVDKHGNAAAVTTSLGAQFLVIGDTGIHINNRMRFLSLEQGNANQVAPGYKVRHTSNPYMAFRNGQLFIVSGNVGADTQAQAQVQQFMDIVEFGLTPQEAIDRARFVDKSFPSTVYPHAIGNTLHLEESPSSGLQQQLEARGHNIVVGDAIFGNAGMIVIGNAGTTAQVGVETRNEVSSGKVILPSEEN